MDHVKANHEGIQPAKQKRSPRNFVLLLGLLVLLVVVGIAAGGIALHRRSAAGKPSRPQQAAGRQLGHQQAAAGQHPGTGDAQPNAAISGHQKPQQQQERERRRQQRQEQQLQLAGAEPTPMAVMLEALAFADAEPHVPLLQPRQLYLLHAGQAAAFWRDQAKEMEAARAENSTRTVAEVEQQQEAGAIALAIKQTLQQLLLMAQLRERQSHDSGLGSILDVTGTTLDADSVTLDSNSASPGPPKPAQGQAAGLQRSAGTKSGGGGSGMESLQVKDKHPHVCVVVRTYHAHGPDQGSAHPGPLRQLLDSLVTSGMESWEALVVMADQKTFPALPEIIKSVADPRVKIHTMLVGPEYAAHGANGGWRDGYHHTLFNITDTAIEACSPNTTWLTVTNGDNVYDHAFWQEVVVGPREAHVLAFDFYSRYQRYTGRQCYRFASAPGAPRCKENLLRFFNVDLASVALDWKRWTSERRGFARTDMTDFEKGQGWHDAFAIHALMEAGWHAHWVGPGTRCLVAHSPSPQLCAMEGGVWDDSTKDFGGPSCRTFNDGMRKAHEPGLQLLNIDLTHDPMSFQRAAGAEPSASDPPTWPPGNFTVPCLRSVEETMLEQTWSNPEFYHRCAALLDQPAALLEATRQQLASLHALHAKSQGGLLAAAEGLLMDSDKEEL